MSQHDAAENEERSLKNELLLKAENNLIWGKKFDFHRQETVILIQF